MTLGNKCEIKCLNWTLSTNCNGKLFSQLQGQGLIESSFFAHQPFWKVFVQQKN
jgi:hypothetical protein